MVNGLHLYSAFIQSALQFLPLIHPFTHTFTHQRRLAAMQGTNQLVRSNWGLGVLLKDTSTRPGWDRTGNPPTARRQLYLLSHIVHNIMKRFRLSGEILVCQGQGQKLLLNVRDHRAHICEGTIDLEAYVGVLERHMLPSTQRLFPGTSCLFQQDNARPHSAGVTTAWLRRHRVHVLDWPACSPDLSPIENV